MIFTIMVHDKFIFNNRVWEKGGWANDYVIFWQERGLSIDYGWLGRGVEKGPKIDYVICERSPISLQNF